MKARIKHAIAIGAAISLVPLAQAVAGIDIQAGDWKLDFSGNINAFYVNASCDHGENTAVTGGLACTGDNATSVRNGLLPAAFVFTASTRQDNLDISATIGLYPGINSSAAAGVNGAGLPAALQTPGIDARQEFLTFGDASWGTVKMGRDIGIFAKDAILDDMTLLGVGTASGNAAPGNTSLGRIGLGYIYTDWIPQITYTTANFGGFTASVGAFTPLDDGNYTSHNSPQFQGGLAYVFGDPKSDPVTGKVWLDAVTQQAKAPSADVADNTAAGIQNSTKGTGVDGGSRNRQNGHDREDPEGRCEPEDRRETELPAKQPREGGACGIARMVERLVPAVLPFLPAPHPAAGHPGHRGGGAPRRAHAAVGGSRARASRTAC